MTEWDRKLLAKQEELRALEENLRTSRSPIEVRSYFETYADVYCEIQRLSTSPTAVTIHNAPNCFCCPTG